MQDGELDPNEADEPPPPQEERPEAAADEAGEEPGPYVINHGARPIDWAYSLRPGGPQPTAREAALAYKCSKLSNRMRIFSSDAKYDGFHSRIADGFSVALVQPSPEILVDEINRQVDDVEREFVTEHATIRYRWRVALTLGLGCFLALLAGIGWHGLQLNRSLAAYEPYMFVTFGVLFGRIISLFMVFGRRLTDFEDYETARSLISNPYLDALIDVLIGFVACLAFVTKAIVISIGDVGAATDSDGAVIRGLTTEAVGTSWEIAMIFGVFVGLARAQFLNRLSQTSRRSMG